MKKFILLVSIFYTGYLCAMIQKKSYEIVGELQNVATMEAQLQKLNATIEKPVHIKLAQFETNLDQGALIDIMARTKEVFVAEYGDNAVTGLTFKNNAYAVINSSYNIVEMAVEPTFPLKALLSSVQSALSAKSDITLFKITQPTIALCQMYKYLNPQDIKRTDDKMKLTNLILRLQNDTNKIKSIPLKAGDNKSLINKIMGTETK